MAAERLQNNEALDEVVGGAEHEAAENVMHDASVAGNTDHLSDHEPVRHTLISPTLQWIDAYNATTC